MKLITITVIAITNSSSLLCSIPPKVSLNFLKLVKSAFLWLLSASCRQVLSIYIFNLKKLFLLFGWILLKKVSSTTFLIVNSDILNQVKINTSSKWRKSALYKKYKIWNTKKLSHRTQSKLIKRQHTN